LGDRLLWHLVKEYPVRANITALLDIVDGVVRSALAKGFWSNSVLENYFIANPINDNIWGLFGCTQKIV
jgi:hypothetical protein